MNYKKTLTKNPQLVALIFLLSCLFPVSYLYGQNVQENNEMRKELDSMFEHLDKKTVPTGLLRDYAVEYDDLDLFTGEVPLDDKNIVNIVRFGDLLKTISSSAVKEDPLKNLEKSIRSTKKHHKSGEINLGIMLYEYARIKSNALQDGLIRYENGKVYNIETKESPYQIERVFAGCYLQSTINQTNVSISIPANLLLTNCNIKNIEIDYGSGFKNIQPGQSVNAILKEGVNRVNIRVILQNGKTLNTHSAINVQDTKSLAQSRAFFPNALTLNDSIIIDGTWNTVNTKAEVYISYAPGRNTLQKPLIIVEGFDPRTEPGSKGSWNFNIIKVDQNIYDLNKKYGYDIVYVDWRQATEYIQANSHTLINVIKEVNRRKTSSEPNVIIGHSMGGLAARYALKTMENGNIRHQVSTYVSYDAPHLGAHIPVGVLYGFHAINTFLNSHGVIDILLSMFTSADEYIDLGKALAYSTAAQQMLVEYVDPSGNYNNIVHNNWQNELKTLGFPKGDVGTSFQMLAVSNANYGTVTVPPYYLKTKAYGSTDIDAIFLPATGMGDATLSTILGLGLNDILAGLLTLLPGRTQLDCTFDVYPALSYGSQVTNIRLQYKKKFLWVIDISRTLFTYDKFYYGKYFWDTYPSSYYSLLQNSNGLPLVDQGDKVPLVFDYSVFVDLKYIPFVSTSSALAFGDGINIIPANFLNPPHGQDSPFGENYFTFETLGFHMFFETKALDWVTQRLSTSIVGPKVGYTGAQYSLSKASGSVSWTSSDANIATISSTGILTTRGNGFVTLVANNSGQSYSQTIMVGIPRHILTASHVPGGYEINADCIDAQYNEHLPKMNGVIRYNWGVKYPNEDIGWFESSSPNLIVQLKGQNESVIVFLEIIDDNGNKTTLQHIEINSQDVYVVQNQNLYIDSQGNLYKENKSKYSYTSARLFISYRPNIPAIYMERTWMATTAKVLRPFSDPSITDARYGGPLIREILPIEEFEYIRDNSVDNEVYRYTVILQNSNSQAIQFIPVIFTYKTKM